VVNANMLCRQTQQHNKHDGQASGSNDQLTTELKDDFTK